MNVSSDRKVKKLAYLTEYWLDLAQIGCRGYFWILNPKSIKEILYDVILTSKWREDKIPIYCLQKMHMTSLWRHLLFNFFENVNYYSPYKGLSAHQIWFNLDQGKQSYGGGRNPPPTPGWECIKSPRWDRVNPIGGGGGGQNVPPYRFLPGHAKTANETFWLLAWLIGHHLKEFSV